MLSQFPVQIPLADSKNLGRIAAVTVAGFDRQSDVGALPLCSPSCGSFSRDLAALFGR